MEHTFKSKRTLKQFNDFLKKNKIKEIVRIIISREGIVMEYN